MTTEQFDSLLKGCIENSGEFYLILQESGGVPDRTDWYAVEFNTGERYSFIRMETGCTGTFSLYGSYVDKVEVSDDFFDNFYEQVRLVTQKSSSPSALLM
jgi:hypothetical protein